MDEIQEDPRNKVPKPGNPLHEVKKLISQGDWYLDYAAPQTAWNDFGWDDGDVKRCLLKLNDRYHAHDPERNHFWKQEKHTDIPKAVMDYYKARKIMEDQSVYTHLFIDPLANKVVVNSFKKL